MIKINGPTETNSGAKVRKTARSGASFEPRSANSSESSSIGIVSKTAPAGMMDALLALQGDGGGSAKAYAAAQRTLELLEKMQLQLLGGKVTKEDLETLSRAATMRARADADPGLLEVYDQIALRARVEIAKLDR